MPADDLPADWWTNRQVRDYLTTHGLTIARSTWSSWVSRGHAPRPDPKGRIGPYPRWRAEDIRQWSRRFRPDLFGTTAPPD